MKISITLNSRESENLSDETRRLLSPYRTNRQNEWSCENVEAKKIAELVRNIREDVESAGVAARMNTLADE